MLVVVLDVFGLERPPAALVPTAVGALELDDFRRVEEHDATARELRGDVKLAHLVRQRDRVARVLVDHELTVVVVEDRAVDANEVRRGTEVFARWAAVGIELANVTVDDRE